MSKIWKTLSPFISIFIILLAVTLFYASQLELPEGEKVGSGLFYLKGHYVETEVIGGVKKEVEVYDQGIGVITIPLVCSILITGLYLIIIRNLRKKSLN